MKTIRSMIEVGTLRLLAVGGALFGLSASVLATEGEPLPGTRVAIRVDCLHDFGLSRGSNQTCITLSGLKLSHLEQVAPKVQAYLAVDPFATTTPSLALRPRVGTRTFPSARDTPLHFVSDYSLNWYFRPHLTLALKQFGSATLLPSFSGLSLGSEYQESGWYQTALTAEYKLGALEGMLVRIALGNGEGENSANLDPEQFGALEIDTEIVQGVGVKLGMSFDGNNVGSQAYPWQFGGDVNPNVPPPHLGFSTQRVAAALYMNGEVSGAHGLKMAFGFQRNRQSDLDKEIRSIPEGYSYATGAPLVEAQEVLVEDPSNVTANTVERTVQAFSMSYVILADYFLGFDYEKRRTSSGTIPFFQACRTVLARECAQDGGKRTSIQQSAYTIGGGVTIEDNLRLVIEYRAGAYDNLYETFNYQGGNNGRGKEEELFNARMTYNW